MSEMKALLIIINSGFADDIVALARECGARGATIINARGTASVHSFMGINVDPAKEIIISLVTKEVADLIIQKVDEMAGNKTSANGICFYMPVELMTNVNKKN
jgi:nitrogen regulatory protein PII